ncbi:hypothetical protein DPMN_003150 [Dreissena polymorpha]|uniref:Uncharacterized protein n=1 Tax=Dreissena polymorpha TaxID=45954 RepID=A0A9D4MKE5_DREPO|nr:hypothetical protein DPMN_003150 [Dreissena polymorpha]
MSSFWNRCREPFTAANILLHCNLVSLQRRRLRAALHSHGLVLNLFIEERCKGPVFSVLSKYQLDILITDKILVFGKEAVNPTNVSYILRGNIPGLILVIWYRILIIIAVIGAMLIIIKY